MMDSDVWEQIFRPFKSQEFHVVVIAPDLFKKTLQKGWLKNIGNIDINARDIEIELGSLWVLFQWRMMPTPMGKGLSISIPRQK